MDSGTRYSSGEQPAPGRANGKVFQVAMHAMRGSLTPTEAARSMWSNLRGILRLVVDDGCAVDTAPAQVKSVIAQPCGMDDFDAPAGGLTGGCTRDSR